MDIPKKVGSEITVRISLTFQDAPDVHTLLAMTPVRQRGKLVKLALERYIQETGHKSGNVDTQIEVITSWLRSRTTDPNGAATNDGMPKAIDTVIKSVTVEDSLTRLPSTVIIQSPMSILSNTIDAPENNLNKIESFSMKRWFES